MFNFKNVLIKKKDDLIKNLKKNNRAKKADRDYYGYEENKFYGLKDVRNLFDQDDDNDFYDGIEYFFSENNLEYEEIKEYDNDIYEIIKQEEVKYEHIEEAIYVKTKPCLIVNEKVISQEKKNKQCLIDCEYIVIKEKKVE